MSVIFKRTKILATIGPVTDTSEQIEAMITAGTNGFRFNFSHATFDGAKASIERVRTASNKLNKPVAILQDLQGPKVRLGMLNQNITVTKGDELILDYASGHEQNSLPVQYNLAE